MTIAVAGVSGNTGRALADSLLEQGRPVRVIVRDADKGEPWGRRGAEVAVADIGDTVALTRALRGASGAYLLIPPSFTEPNFREYQLRLARSIAAAVKASELPELVFLSSNGAQHEAGTGPIVALHRAEELLRPLPTRTAFLRAGYFMENLGGSLSMLDKGLVTSFMPANLTIHMVATLDVGRAGAQLLSEGIRRTEPVQVSGPKPVSMQDAAAALSTLLGRKIEVAEAPLSAMVSTLVSVGLPSDLAALYHEMTLGIVSGHVAFETGPRWIHGSVTIEQVLSKLLSKGGSGHG